MTSDPTSALRAHRAQVSVSKRKAVLVALDEAADQSVQVSVAGVARRAGVSREFIHSHRDLHDRVKQVAAAQADAQRNIEAGHADLHSGRVADRSTLMTKVLRQKNQIDALTTRVRNLEAARARHLGEQLISLDATPIMSAEESLITAERLAAENERLQRELDEAARIVARLRNELGGARQALAEALLDKVAAPNSPISLNSKR
jgi:hypothetical protein